MQKDNNQKIKCNVESCEHNDCSCGCCDLKEITVSCNCDHTEATKKDETICANFKCNSNQKED